MAPTGVWNIGTIIFSLITLIVHELVKVPKMISKSRNIVPYANSSLINPWAISSNEKDLMIFMLLRVFWTPIFGAASSTDTKSNEFAAIIKINKLDF